MRRTAVFLLAAATAALLPAAPADAYRLQSHRWYSRTLTYYDATGKYRSEVRAAARQWNISGARVRVRSAPRRSARVLIRVERRLASAGQARYPVIGGVTSQAVVGLRADLAENFSSSAEARAGIVAVIAHELGHVLGLNHENRRCALMNSSLWSRCARAPERWRYRCRTLESDDIRGIVRRFGGRVRKRGSEFCAAEAAPGTPVGVAAATVDPENGIVRLTWTMPAGKVARARVLRRAGTCPTGPDDAEAQVVAEIKSGPGRAQTADDYVSTPGRYCYVVVGLGALGRPSALAAVTHDVLGEPPLAAFSETLTGPRQIEFDDLSTDRDGQIVAWRWDFGDGATSAESNPTHVYAAAGVYQVTLTVSDDSGQSSSSTHTVRIT